MKSLIDVGYTVKDIKHMMSDKTDNVIQVDEIVELIGEITLDKVILNSSRTIISRIMFSVCFPFARKERSQGEYIVYY